MHDIFISYSTLDSKLAHDIREFLERSGISCWIAPRDIPSGSNYTKEIPAAIRGCQVFVLLLTEHSQHSQWVLRELDSAVNERKVIIPVVMDDAPLSDEFGFLLSGAQRHPAFPFTSDALLSLRDRIMSILHPGEEPENKDTSWVPVTAFTGGEPPKGVVCPACRSTDLKEKPKKIRRHGYEWFTLLLIPLCAAVSYVLSFSLAGLILYAIPTNNLSGAFYTNFLSATVVVSLTVGGVLGDLLGRELIRRKRVRQHLTVQEFRCNACSKNFCFTEKRE